DNCVTVRVLGNRAEHAVAHQQSRFGGVEDDDRLAARSPADLLDPPRGGAGERVDRLTRAWPGGGTRDGRHDLGVWHVTHVAYGRHHRNRGLAAARDHVYIGRLPVTVEVYDGDDPRPELRGCEVDR